MGKIVIYPSGNRYDLSELTWEEIREAEATFENEKVVEGTPNKMIHNYEKKEKDNHAK